MLTTRLIKSYFLKVFANKKHIDFDIKNTKNVLFLRYDRIGDMIITTPVFRELKQAYPQIKISVLASKTNQEVLINNPYIEKVITNYKNSFFADLPSLINLRRQNFDLCFEFDHSVIPHSIIRLRVIKPKKIISIKKTGRYGINGDDLSLYDIYTEKFEKSHFRDIWLGLLKPLNINSKSNTYDLFLDNIDMDKAQKFVKKYSDKFLIGINLEGAVKGKKIKFHQLCKICKGIYNNDNNIQIIILCSPNNFQRVSKKVQEIGLHYVVMSYKTEKILNVAALISELDLIITPDTSIVHIASTFNKPLVSIHENNRESYELFAPVSELNRTVFSDSKDNISRFSLSLLLRYTFELMSIIKQENYDE